MGRIGFSIASTADEPDIRRLLRENPMQGNIAMTLEREPDAFAADFGLAKSHHFVIARDGQTGRPVGLCEREVFPMYVNGKAQQVPYIGSLRVAESHRNRIAILRGGFAALRSLEDGHSYAITSISEANAVALRILTAGVKGLPVYTPLGSFATRVIAVRRSGASAETLAAGPFALSAADWNRQHQFGMQWTARDLQRLERAGLPPSRRLGLAQGSTVIGTIGVWDQRSNRQAVVRRYPPWLGAVRTLYNAAARVMGRLRLPALGEAMNVAVASHFSWNDAKEETFLRLIRAALACAARAGQAGVAFGFAAESLCHRLLCQHFPRALEFRTRFFSVTWPDSRVEMPNFDGRTLHPELGLL